jgi:RNA-directed DNA polymerase
LNFLGFNGRPSRRTTEGKCKTLIKPDKDQGRRHLQQIGKIIREMGRNSPRELIGKITPRIAGGSNYYRTCVAGETFTKADNVVYGQRSEWATKPRRMRSIRRKMRRDFKKAKSRNWVCATNEGKTLLRHDATKIVRHIKVQGSKSPFDGDGPYWATRLGHRPLLSPRRARGLKEQKGQCGSCQLLFRYEDILEVHHVDGEHKNNKRNNLRLIHGHCHDQITAQMQRTQGKGSVTEEPCAGKLASTVLKQRCEGRPVHRL